MKTIHTEKQFERRFSKLIATAKLDEISDEFLTLCNTLDNSQKYLLFRLIKELETMKHLDVNELMRLVIEKLNLKNN